MLHALGTLAVVNRSTSACVSDVFIRQKFVAAFQDVQRAGKILSFFVFEIQFLECLLHVTLLPRVVRFLPPKLIHQLWKGFGWIIRVEKNGATSERLLVNVLTVPNVVVTSLQASLRNRPRYNPYSDSLWSHFAFIFKKLTSQAFKCVV